MSKRNYISAFWEAVLAQDEVAMQSYFDENSRIYWHNTNEKFAADEFIKANCQYPGEWEGTVERFVETDDTVITVVKVKQKGMDCAFHVTSFFKLKENKINHIDEYWGDDGDAPQWRLELKIGRKIVD